MEVKVVESIEIQKPLKKQRPRIGQGHKSAQVDNASTYSSNFKADAKPNNKEKTQKPRFNKPQRPQRSVEDIKAGIVNSLESVGGKYVKFEDVNHTEGLLVCGVVDPEDQDRVTSKDIYFAVVDHDRHLVYVNCNNRFSVMREPSMKCSILDWLYRNEAQTIYDIAMNTLEDHGVEIFTKTYLVVPKVEKKKDNKKKGNKKPAKK